MAGAPIELRLSATVPLSPGDVICTGTPAGIGFAREPKVLPQPEDELVTSIETIGSICTRFTAGTRRPWPQRHVKRCPDYPDLSG
ncbi:MAG: fumarylacetoacetate hydrolase family protein [Actinomycetota bacterium]|nr:fumarylacetoacetate hydrolase family protein [Actinomycetota bacterium]